MLRKPLRPLWISPSSLIWTDQVAQPDQLGFTPLILLSASQTTSYQRKSLSKSCALDLGQQRQQQQLEPPACLQAGLGGEQGGACGGGEGEGDWTYIYVPGAGDDEESWAAGLSPMLFWAHHQVCVCAPGGGVREALHPALMQAPGLTGRI